MGRELRQRKHISYNENALSVEASSAAASNDDNNDQGSLLKFTRAGINNTAKSSSLQLASAKFKQYKRNKACNKQDAGNSLQRRRYI